MDMTVQVFSTALVQDGLFTGGGMPGTPDPVQRLATLEQASRALLPFLDSKPKTPVRELPAHTQSCYQWVENRHELDDEVETVPHQEPATATPLTTKPTVAIVQGHATTSPKHARADSPADANRSTAAAPAQGPSARKTQPRLPSVTRAAKTSQGRRLAQRNVFMLGIGAIFTLLVEGLVWVWMTWWKR